jgi:hypothetical protein
VAERSVDTAFSQTAVASKNGVALRLPPHYQAPLLLCDFPPWFAGQKSSWESKTYSPKVYQQILALTGRGRYY